MGQALLGRSRSILSGLSGLSGSLPGGSRVGSGGRLALLLLGVGALLAGPLGVLAPKAAAQPEERSAAPASAADSVPLPPEGWWVPATLKMPRAAEGRLAWRFTLKEIITISRDNKLERHPSDLSPVATAPGRPRTWKTTASAAVKQEATTAASPARPVSALPPISIEYDQTKGSVTLTFTGAKAAFFTLNPAGTEDSHRFDNLVIDKHADSAEVRDACDKATRCCRFTQQPAECVPKNTERTLSRCKEILNTVRQELGSEHRAIPSACR